MPWQNRGAGCRLNTAAKRGNQSQSSLHRAASRDSQKPRRREVGSECFNPLCINARRGTGSPGCGSPGCGSFQSSLHRGASRDTTTFRSCHASTHEFQSSLHRGASRDHATYCDSVTRAEFQSSLHRGASRDGRGAVRLPPGPCCFNPLCIEARRGTITQESHRETVGCCFNPLCIEARRGTRCRTTSVRSTKASFNPLCIEARRGTQSRTSCKTVSVCFNPLCIEARRGTIRHRAYCRGFH